MIEDILKDMKPFTDVLEFFNTPDKDPYNRTAKTANDFEKIYKREFDKSQISDEVFFQKHLINIIEEKENIYESYLKTTKQRAWRENATTLELIYNFKQWVINNPIIETQTQKENYTFIPKGFNEIFINPILINDCIELLRDTEKPCINDENGFLRHKGIFIIWFNALEAKKMFNCSFGSDFERAATLNKNFAELNVSGSSFRSENKRATELYKNHFEREISTLKH